MDQFERPSVSVNPQFPPQPPRMRGERSGCLWMFIVVESLALLFVVIMVIGLFALFSGGEEQTVGVDDCPPLKEVWAYGEGNTKVVKIPLRGMIVLSREQGVFSDHEASATLALKSIRRATYDKDVMAIIMDIDSGGGGITASDIIYKALLDFKKAVPGRKVVALFRDIAASGAYYIAMASDYIIAHPTTVTGSIGVIIQTLNLTGLEEKIGVKDVTIKSGENKDMLSPFHDITPQQTNMLQNLIDQMHGHFVGIVVKGRGIDEEKVRKLADGSIFTASDALELGLIDEIGYWDDAVAKTKSLLGKDKIKIYRYEPSFSLSALFGAKENFNPVSRLMREANGVRLMYLWRL